MGHILTVGRMDVIKENNLKECIIFFDFSNAFDSIDRNKIAEILRSYIIPMETVNVIMILFENTK